MTFALKPPPLSTHGRYAYSAIHQRPDYSWPQGRRLAVYIALNLEHFAFGEGLGATLVPGVPQPDVLNYAWRDYGNRVGVWRLLDMFNALDLPVAALVNAAMYDYCPTIMTAFRDRGDEIVAHGWTNSECQGEMSVVAEQAMIAETTQTLTRHEGQAPQGWLSPWISQTWQTLDLLQASGYTYMLDWACDDQPLWFQTQTGRILSIPYPQEINDIPAIAVRRASAREFADMIVDNFDEMLEQSQQQPLVYGIALHAYLVGQPFRLRHLRPALSHIAQHRADIWLTHPGAIARHLATLPAGTIP